MKTYKRVAGLLATVLMATTLIACKPETKTIEVIKEVEVVKEVTTPTISREYIAPSTYWCIPQYYGADKSVPKYCAVGTYTHKHIPLAYKAEEDIYHVFTELADNNFYVYAMKNNTEKVLVHTIEDWNDPHTNAVIHVLESGIVHVHVASRGLNFKFQSGKVLESKTPYELDFECISGCSKDDVNIEAYPQVWETSWGEHVGYTHYLIDERIHPSRNVRTLWYRTDTVTQQLVEGGHYAISYYDGTALYVAYNQLIDAKPDTRINLYIMKTVDGVNWTNIDGKPLVLPLLTHDTDTLVYETDSYVYLKDITVKDTLSIIFTESTSFDPTKGERFVREWTKDSVETITETNHNYNAGAYVGDNILITQDGIENWIGGDVVLYDENYNELDRDTSSNCNYIRKVINSANDAVVSCDNFHLDKTSSHFLLKVNN